jgi:SAM-dependent methyltransferase
LESCDAAFVQQLKNVPMRIAPSNDPEYMIGYRPLDSFRPPFTCAYMARAIQAEAFTNIDDVCSVMMELIATMGMARDRYSFYWGDAHPNNVIVTRLPSGMVRRYVINGNHWATNSQFMPVLIDFENSTFNNPHRSGTNSDVKGIIRICIAWVEQFTGQRLPSPIYNEQRIRVQNPPIADVFLNQAQDMSMLMLEHGTDSATAWQPFLDILIKCPVFFKQFRGRVEQTTFDRTWRQLMAWDNDAEIALLTAGKLGTAQVYGTPTFASVRNIIRELDIRSNDTIIDIGSGFGNVLFLAEALVPATCRLIGIEYQQAFHDLAMRRKQMLNSRVELQHLDFMQLQSFRNLNVPSRLIIVMFDVAFPPDLTNRIFELFYQFPQAGKLVSCYNHNYTSTPNRQITSTPMNSTLIIGMNDELGAENDVRRHVINTVHQPENYDAQDIINDPVAYNIDMRQQEYDFQSDGEFIADFVIPQLEEAEVEQNWKNFKVETGQHISRRKFELLPDIIPPHRYHYNARFVRLSQSYNSARAKKPFIAANLVSALIGQFMHPFVMASFKFSLNESIKLACPTAW